MPSPVRRAPDLQELHEQHAPFVRALARHLLGAAGDPDDVVQEVFVVAWRRRDHFDAATARPWLCQVTVKVCSHARRRARIGRWLGLERAAEVADWNTPELSAETREAFAVFDAALNQMPEKRRTVFVLYEVHGFSGQEIAGMLGCPLKTVHTRLFHARREFLARVGPEVPGPWNERGSRP